MTDFDTTMIVNKTDNPRSFLQQTLYYKLQYVITLIFLAANKKNYLCFPSTLSMFYSTTSFPVLQELFSICYQISGLTVMG